MTALVERAHEAHLDFRAPAVRLAQLPDHHEQVLPLVQEDDSGVTAVRGRIDGAPVVAYCTDATRMNGALGSRARSGSSRRSRSPFGSAARSSGCGTPVAHDSSMGSSRWTAADHGEGGAFGKHTFAPQSQQVPLIIHAPGRVPVGRRDDLAQSLDLGRTLAGLTGVTLPESFGERDLFADPAPEPSSRRSASESRQPSLPEPCLLSRRTWAWWRPATAATIDRPRPLPPLVRLRPVPVR